jgi:hypothetical protein
VCVFVRHHREEEDRRNEDQFCEVTQLD